LGGWGLGFGVVAPPPNPKPPNPQSPIPNPQKKIQLIFVLYKKKKIIRFNKFKRKYIII